MDPMTLLLLGAGSIGLGGLFKGIASFFGGKRKKKEIERQLKALQEAHRRAYEERMQQVIPYVEELRGTTERVRRISEEEASTLRALIPRAQRAYEEFARGLEQARAEIHGARLGIETAFEKETATARERVGEAYGEAIRQAREFAGGEVQRHLESLGVGAGSGLGAILASREMQRATLPLLEAQAGAITSLEQAILRERGDISRVIAGLIGEEAGYIAQRAGLGVQELETERGLLSDIFRTLMQGEMERAQLLESAVGLLPAPTPEQFFFYKPTSPGFFESLLEGLGGALSGAGQGLAMASGMGVSGGGGGGGGRG